MVVPRKKTKLPGAEIDQSIRLFDRSSLLLPITATRSEAR
jgi:hypothetical protein